MAAPTPVTTPQAIRHALSKGISVGILIAALECTTVCVANVPQRKTCEHCAPSRERVMRGLARKAI